MMRMLRLARQRLRASWKIHLAAALLTCLTCAAFITYQSYMGQMGQSFSRQANSVELLADLQVELPDGELLSSPAVPVGAWKSRPTPTVIAMARGLQLSSQYGQLQVTVLQPEEAYTGPLPQAGQVLVNQHLAGGLGLPTAGPLTLSGLDLDDAITLQIGGTFASGAPSGHVLALASDVYPLLKTAGSNIFFYDLIDQLSVNSARDALARFYPNSLITDSRQAHYLAQQTVSDTYQGFGNLVLLIFVFLTLGVLTALLLSFIDSKRELSVLKSLGLTPRELWGIFLINGLGTAAIGTLSGFALTYFVGLFMQTRGLALTLTSEHVLAVSWRIAIAYALAIAVPAGLAKRATVNQLLYDQPIPLISRQVTSLQRHRVTFEREIAAGWQVMSLPVIDGVLEGFVFKAVGDRVKMGEVIAFSPSWWGLAYTEYVAVVDGEVTLWQEDSGIFAIKPD